MVKALKIIGVSFGVIILILFVVGYSIFSGMCANTIISESISQDKKWKAVLFERNCGATTGFSSQISILKAQDELEDEGGNIYIADGYPKGYSLNWKSKLVLRVTGANNKTYKKETHFNGVKVIYE